MQHFPRLLRMPAVCDATGLGITKIYDQIKHGLFPPQIKLTERNSAWPAHEVAAVNAARIAGKSDAEIKTLVKKLVVARASLPALVNRGEPAAA
jgi:prophage regulatory protein